MDKVWLKSYPLAMPETVDLGTYESLVDMFEQSARQYAARPAFTNFGTTLSYAQVDRLSTQLAAYLQHLPNLQRGDRIAIMLPNILQSPLAIFSVLRAGFSVVSTNPLYTHRELKHQLSDSGAKAIIVLENCCRLLSEIIPETEIEYVITTQLGDLLEFPKSWLVNFGVKYIKRMVPRWSLPGCVQFRQALRQGCNLSMQKVAVTREDLAFLQYTGGTTGVAKGAMLTHGNMVANLLQASTWINAQVVKGGEVIITALPLYHIFSLTANCLIFFKIGAQNYLITDPRNMRGFIAELKKIEFTAITGVNTLFAGLLNTPGFDRVDFSHLKLTLGGGAAIQPIVAKRWKQVTGSTLVEAYGLTEAAPAVCINPLDLTEFNGSIGLPVPSTEVSIQDPQGHFLPFGEVGELCVRGPQVMQGYWLQEQETVQVLTAAGWLKTGDMGTMDAMGYCRIVDRLKDMILVSGFNVYPNEVEAVIAEHKGVLEVGVIGEPKPGGGEVVKAVIVKKDPALTLDAIMEHCRQRLTGYKVPQLVVFRSELPKTNVGKILRRALRES